MAKFVFKLLVLGLITVGGFAEYIYYGADGRTDPYYLKVASGRYDSLVLGSSRAAQGVRPEFLDGSELSFSRPMYNFCFTLSHSPYGPYYLSAIRKKLKKDSTDGLFIVEVNPWSVSSLVENVEDDPGLFGEKDSFVGNLHSFSVRPNLEYMVRHYDQAFYKIAYEKVRVDRYYHILRDDGWLEVFCEMDEDSVRGRKAAKVDVYRGDAGRMRFSPARLGYLEETIGFLKGYGKVYVVRLPVAAEMMAIERGYMPEFEERMRVVCGSCDVPYIDLSGGGEGYETTDGNHLSKDAAAAVTEEIVRRIAAIERLGFSGK